MHYLVRHSEGDVRFQSEDGTEPLSTGWSEFPNKHEIADQCADDGPGGSLLGQSDLRAAFIDVVSDDVAIIDLVNEDRPLPWK